MRHPDLLAVLARSTPSAVIEPSNAAWPVRVSAYLGTAVLAATLFAHGLAAFGVHALADLGDDGAAG
jgi:hypothetical protein